jgi:integrase/recombinase XerD
VFVWARRFSGSCSLTFGGSHTSLSLSRVGHDFHRVLLRAALPFRERRCETAHLCADLKRPAFRASLYRALLLILYCTGIRFGEALRLRMRDVDTRTGVLFVATFKGRARWVPFHGTLSRELGRYLAKRVKYAPSGLDTRFFVGTNQRLLPVSTAHGTIYGLFAKAGLKPEKGRVGPRPYDLRHAFAVQRLTRWYRQGADLHARLPWLSAYMGHVDIVGTEAYLNATPELLQLAAHRLHRRYRKPPRGKEQSL